MSFFLSSAGDQPARAEVINPDVTTGHLHHLDNEQQAAFDAFKQSIAKAGLYHPPADPDRPRPSHDDPTLLSVLVSLIFFSVSHLCDLVAQSHSYPIFMSIAHHIQ